MRKLRGIVAALAVTLLVPVAALAQQRGVVAGRVVDQTTSRPVVGAQVIVVGTTLGVRTNQAGEYRIEGVPAGAREVSATVIGYATGTQRVTVTAGGTATVDFQLQQSALELGGLVVTATGREQRQREIGSSVSAINVEDVELAAVQSMSQLVQGRAAGAVVMQTSGTTGTGSRIRIRGNNSMSLSNAPLLIVDGVRVESSESSLGFGVGGQSVSRLDDLNPEDIESIEILKGPAASALYGTAAANGVIQVTTKRGRAGAPEFRVWSEFGSIERVAEFPENVYAEGTLVPGAGVTNVRPGQIGRCDIIRQAIGSTPGRGEVGCSAVTETFRFNPLENGETTPFRDGGRRTYGASVSGGGEGATFYVSGEYENEDGILSQSQLERGKIQANLTGEVGSSLRISGKVGYIESDLDLPIGDNALFGIVPMGLFGSPRPQFVESQQGFESDPKFAADWISVQDQSRLTASLQGDYQPISWLTFNGTAGLDRVAREEVNRIPRNSAYRPFGSFWTNGWIQDYNYDIYNVTTNASGTAVFNLLDDLVSTTTAGTAYLREDFHRIYAFGANLTPGVERSLAGAASDFSASEANILNSTVSAYMQQQLAWRDKIFVNAAVRGDQNTAFGTDIGWIWYPAFSGSWVVSEESFFPDFSFLSNLRLRGAWGQSGLRPGATDALLSFTGTVSTFNNLDVSAFSFNDVGNPDLKPELSTEWEAGFESGFFDERLGLDLTYFNKKSEDALVSRPLPPSAGASNARFENIGEVRNSGVEVMLSAQPVLTNNFEWNFRVSGSALENELVDLGVDTRGNPIAPIVFGAQRHAQGYPLGSWFQWPITKMEDTNGNGLLSLNEVTVGDSVQFMGNPFPNREFSFSTDVRMFDWVRLSALVDHKGGHEMLNYTRAWRCADKGNCAQAYDRSTPLEEQAAIIARLTGRRSYAGFIEKADFTKLREVALTLSVPREYTRRFGSDGLSITLAGRNLATWTDYSGFDPEVNWAGGANFTSGDFATLPPNRTFTLRVDANF